MLLVAFEQGKQLAMVRINLFSKIEDERKQIPADHPACKASVSFMQKLIEMYCSGKVEKSQLNAITHNIVLTPR